MARKPKGSKSSAPELSVVLPVHNEAGNILPVVGEIHAALQGVTSFEIVYTDDGSTDETLGELKEAQKKYGSVRIMRHDTACGQSRAVATAIKAARGRLIATLDGDGQNDPADIPKLLEAFRDAKADPDLVMIAGLRAKRKDTPIRRLSSRIANAIRRRMLRDDTPDSGCGLKVFTRDAFLDMPYFDHMHRFLPALMKRRGGTVISIAVNHRPRERGRSKYGIWNRLWVGIVDLFGVMWLRRRAKSTAVSEVMKES